MNVKTKTGTGLPVLVMLLKPAFFLELNKAFVVRIKLSGLTRFYLFLTGWLTWLAKVLGLNNRTASLVQRIVQIIASLLRLTN